MARKFKRRIALKRKIRRQKRLPVVFFPSVARDVISSHKAANERQIGRASCRERV